MFKQINNTITIYSEHQMLLVNKKILVVPAVWNLIAILKIKKKNL